MIIQLDKSGFIELNEFKKIMLGIFNDGIYKDVYQKEAKYKDKQILK